MKIINYKPKLKAIKSLCIITGVHGNEAFLFNELKNNICPPVSLLNKRICMKKLRTFKC